MTRRRQRYTAQQWARLIKEQQASAEPIEVFCARKRIGASTFTKWRRRIDSGWDASSHNVVDGSGAFVEAVSPSAAVVSLILSKGVRLELPVALGSEKIAELAHAVTKHERH